MSEILTPNSQIRPNDESAALCEHRRNYIPQQQDISPDMHPTRFCLIVSH